MIIESSKKICINCKFFYPWQDVDGDELEDWESGRCEHPERQKIEELAYTDWHSTCDKFKERDDIQKQ